MKCEEFKILIADRNRHVRELLKRELLSEGYRTQAAKNCREVTAALLGDEPPDLLILDLEIPDEGGISVLESIRERPNPLPVVIHTFLTEKMSRLVGMYDAEVVEKSGNIETLKIAVKEMLQRFYPGGPCNEDNHGDTLKER
jgi:DNA-binding response OmpR family regulator